LTNSSRFNEKMNNIFSEAYSVYLKTISVSKDLPELEKTVKIDLYSKTGKDGNFLFVFINSAVMYVDLIPW
jgi:hypothetical protein